MLRGGATQAAVAERFGVTQASVSLAIKRGRIKHETGYVKRDIPWKIKTEHLHLSIPRSLRIAKRIQAGDTEGMPDYMRRQGEGFIRTLEETGTVIHYDPDVEPFFFRVPRRPGVDEGLVREPSES